MAVALTGLCLTGDLLAQETNGPAAAPDAGGATPVMTTQPFPVWGLILLTVLVAASLFAVCRSSRRN